MVWGGGLEDTIPEAHPTDQYSAHHRVPGEPCSSLYHRPGCWHPFVSLANPHSSPPCYRAIFNVCVPILSSPPPPPPSSSSARQVYGSCVGSKLLLHMCIT